MIQLSQKKIFFLKKNNSGLKGLKKISVLKGVVKPPAVGSTNCQHANATYEIDHRQFGNTRDYRLLSL